MSGRSSRSPVAGMSARANRVVPVESLSRRTPSARQPHAHPAVPQGQRSGASIAANPHLCCRCAACIARARTRAVPDASAWRAGLGRLDPLDDPAVHQHGAILRRDTGARSNYKDVLGRNRLNGRSQTRATPRKRTGPGCANEASLRQLGDLPPGRDLRVLLAHDQQVLRGVRAYAEHSATTRENRIRRARRGPIRGFWAPEAALFGVQAATGNTMAPGFPRKLRGLWLGCLDSNQEQLNQNQPCCQLHHTPRGCCARSPARRTDLP